MPIVGDNSLISNYVYKICNIPNEMPCYSPQGNGITYLLIFIVAIVPECYSHFLLKLLIPISQFII